MRDTGKSNGVERKPAPQAGIDWLQHQKESQESGQPSSGEGHRDLAKAQAKEKLEMASALSAAEAPNGQFSSEAYQKSMMASALGAAKERNYGKPRSEEYKAPYQSFSHPHPGQYPQLREVRSTTRTSDSKRQGFYAEGADADKLSHAIQKAGEEKQKHDTIPDTGRQGSQMPPLEPLRYKPQESEPSNATSSNRAPRKRPLMKIFDKYRRPKETPPPMPTSDRPREWPSAQELRNNYQALRGRYQESIDQGKDISDLVQSIKPHKDEHSKIRYNTYTLRDGTTYNITEAARNNLDNMGNVNRSQRTEYKPNNTATSEGW